MPFFALLLIHFIIANPCYGSTKDQDAKPLTHSRGTHHSSHKAQKFYSIQVGVYKNHENAEGAFAFLRELPGIKLDEIDLQQGKRYRVQVGKFESAEKARAYLKSEVMLSQFPDAWVTQIKVHTSHPPKKAPPHHHESLVVHALTETLKNIKVPKVLEHEGASRSTASEEKSEKNAPLPKPLPSATKTPSQEPSPTAEKPRPKTL